MARWILGLTLGAEALYLVAANAFLNFGGASALIVATASITVELSSGWTVIPGVIHAAGVRITIQDHNVQALIQLDTVEVTVRLRELPSRVLHATRVRGEGLVFRFRHRVQPEDKDDARVRALPPIPGFSDPPLFHARAPEAPIPEDRYNLWTAHLEDVDVQGADFWVQQFRYLGHARAVGAFELRPARSLWVGPASVALGGGRVVVAGRGALEQVSGSIECTVHPFDVREAEIADVVRTISTKVKLKGKLAGGEFLTLVLPSDSDLRVDPTGADLDIDTVLKRGVLTPASRVALSGKSLTLRTAQLSVGSAAPWSVVATGARGTRGGRVVANLSQAVLTRRGFDAQGVTLQNAVLGMNSTSLDMTEPLRLAASDFTMGELSAPDLRVLNDDRLGQLRWIGGSGKLVAGRIDHRNGVLSGQANVELSKAIVRTSETEIRGNLSVTARAAALDWRRNTGSFNLKLAGSDFSYADTSRDASCPWGRFAKLEATAELAVLPDGYASGKMDAWLDKGMLIWGDTHAAASLDVRATIKPTDESKGVALRISGIVRAFHLRAKGGPGPPQRWRAEVPETLLDTSLLLKDGLLEGPLELTAQRAQVVVGGVSTRSDVHGRFHLNPLDVGKKTVVVSGVVDVQRARLWNKQEQIEGWWAKVGVSPTQVTVNENLELLGRVSVQMRDGLPGLLALAETGDIPAFLPDLLPLHGLVGTILVRRQCQLTDLRLSSFEGGPLAASGRVQNVPGETSGALLVRLSGLELISTGITLGKSGGFSLFAGDDWLLKEESRMSQTARQVALRGCPVTPSVACE